uniref:Uncharacterized protein n=1 Tax=Knipowitschia caucasica TaxID=637954 RepID=A0AAV2LFX3_KNICA
MMEVMLWRWGRRVVVRRSVIDVRDCRVEGGEEEVSQVRVESVGELPGLMGRSSTDTCWLGIMAERRGVRRWVEMRSCTAGGHRCGRGVDTAGGIPGIWGERWWRVVSIRTEAEVFDRGIGREVVGNLDQSRWDGLGVGCWVCLWSMLSAVLYQYSHV